ADPTATWSRVSSIRPLPSRLRAGLGEGMSAVAMSSTLPSTREKGPPVSFALPDFALDAFVRATLDEDLGIGLPGGGRDVTGESVIPADARFAGMMDSRDPIVVAGLPIAAAFFRALDPAMEIELLVEDGEAVPAGADLMRLSGSARAMLTAE